MHYCELVRRVAVFACDAGAESPNRLDQRVVPRAADVLLDVGAKGLHHVLGTSLFEQIRVMLDQRRSRPVPLDQAADAAVVQKRVESRRIGIGVEDGKACAIRSANTSRR